VSDTAKFLRALRGEGYTVTKARRSGHWHVRDSDGRLIAVASSTPSDHRSLRNFRGALRRAGAVR
jgi:hypothetical protein